MSYGLSDELNAVSAELGAMKNATKWYGIRPVGGASGRCMAAYSTREEAEVRARYHEIEYRTLGKYEIVELVEGQVVPA